MTGKHTNAKVPLVHLGKGGPLVPALGLGCMGMSSIYGQHDDVESLQVLQKAIDTGVTFWDTARIYQTSEEFLSKIVESNRDKVFLCTKFGVVINEKGMGLSGKKEVILEQLATSLKNLKTDHIDLYYQHRIDPDTPVEETMGVLKELVKEGKIKHIGLSECSAETLRRAHAVHPVAAVQMEYSPWCTEIETNGFLATCRELGVAIVAYSPLGRGFLTGQIKKPEDIAADDWRKGLPRFQEENFYKNLDMVTQFEELAKKKGCATSQLVLKWVMAQGDDIIVIPGTKRVKYFEENLGALDVELTAEDLAAIRKIIDNSQVIGERYPPYVMTSLNK